MTNTNNTNANTSILEDPFWKEAFAELDKSFAFDELCKKGEEVYRCADYIQGHVFDGDIDWKFSTMQSAIFFETIKNRRVPSRKSTAGFIENCNRLAVFDDKEIMPQFRMIFEDYFKSLNEFCKAFVEYRQKYVFKK